jgi:uncharacterized protein (DUF1499 family)
MDPSTHDPNDPARRDNPTGPEDGPDRDTPAGPSEPAPPREPIEPVEPIEPMEPAAPRERVEPRDRIDPDETFEPRESVVSEPTHAPGEPAEPPPPPVAPARRRWSRVALAALGLALLVGLVAALAGLGSRWGFWHFSTGFQLLEWSVYGAILTIIVAVIAILRTRPASGRRGMSLAIIALVIGIALVYVPWSWRQTARSVPRIHDVTTDTDNPPEFVAVVPLRADARNPVEYGGPEVAAQQRQGYPDIRPLVLDLPFDRAFQRALDAAYDMGWEIVDTDPEAGRIEATARTFWFGFRDDVVIRLTPVDDRTVLDVRSLSRVGGSDVGTNAKRVRKYLRTVEP